jgi:hypothetical protein
VLIQCPTITMFKPMPLPSPSRRLRTSAIVRTSCCGALVGLAIASSCGGQIIGYLDDAGVYHASDGAVLFSPGAACAGWDASHVADPAPACDGGPDDDSGDGGDPICTLWALGFSPPGFPINESYCGQTNDAGRLCVKSGEPFAVAEQCPAQSAAGNAFCSAWAQQFVVKGTATSFCDAVQGPNQTWLFGCTTTAYGAYKGFCPVGTLAVVGDDGGASCSLPCQP